MDRKKNYLLYSFISSNLHFPILRFGSSLLSKFPSHVLLQHFLVCSSLPFYNLLYYTCPSCTSLCSTIMYSVPSHFCCHYIFFLTHHSSPTDILAYFFLGQTEYSNPSKIPLKTLTSKKSRLILQPLLYNLSYSFAHSSFSMYSSGSSHVEDISMHNLLSLVLFPTLPPSFPTTHFYSSTLQLFMRRVSCITMIFNLHFFRFSFCKL